MLVDPRNIAAKIVFGKTSDVNDPETKRESISMSRENGSPVFVAAIDENLAKASGNFMKEKQPISTAGETLTSCGLCCTF